MNREFLFTLFLCLIAWSWDKSLLAFLWPRMESKYLGLPAVVSGNSVPKGFGKTYPCLSWSSLIRRRLPVFKTGKSIWQGLKLQPHRAIKAWLGDLANRGSNTGDSIVSDPGEMSSEICLCSQSSTEKGNYRWEVEIPLSYFWFCVRIFFCILTSTAFLHFHFWYRLSLSLSVSLELSRSLWLILIL